MQLGKLYDRGVTVSITRSQGAPPTTVKEKLDESVTEEIEEEIFPVRGASFGAGIGVSGGGDDGDDSDTRVGSESFVSVGSVESIEQSHEAMQSKSGCVFVCLDMERKSNVINETIRQSQSGCINVCLDMEKKSNITEETKKKSQSGCIRVCLDMERMKYVTR